MAARPMPEVKLCLLGNTSVGKTCFIRRYLYDAFNENTEPTYQTAHYTKIVQVSNTSFKYRIWDTVGEEKYRSLGPLYYRDSVAAVVMYDITSPKSFESVKTWFSDLRSNSCSISEIALVGNKCDLAGSRKVEALDAMMFARHNNALYFETSAKTGENMRAVFDAISDRLVATGVIQVVASQQSAPSDVVRLADDTKSEKTKSRCCARARRSSQSDQNNP